MRQLKQGATNTHFRKGLNKRRPKNMLQLKERVKQWEIL